MIGLKMFRYPAQLKIKYLFNSIKRYGISPRRSSQGKSDYCMEELKNRALVRISGEGSAEFLQGLITNDINDLTLSMYAMFLNNKGRVLFDSIIYKNKVNNTFLLECDTNAISELVKHLNIYKLRRKLNISPLKAEMKVFCVYNPKVIDEALQSTDETDLIGKMLVSSPIENANVTLVPDPRTSLLGYRMLISEGEKVPQLPLGDLYHTYRYKLGIGEGVDEFLIGQSFPLEMNCDYLQGVSFSKGCYIGQELTARTFHTGVIRKRLMPLVFEVEPLGIPVNTPIEDLTQTRKSPIGKIRAIKGKNGLGLMRVSETIESTSLKVLSTTARSYVPVWWPKDSVEKSYVKIKKSY